MPIHSCATLCVSQMQDCLYCYKKIYRSLDDVSQLKNNSLLKTEEKKFIACTRTKSTRVIDSYFPLLYRWRIFLHTKRDPWPSNFFFFFPLYPYLKIIIRRHAEYFELWEIRGSQETFSIKGFLSLRLPRVSSNFQ